MRQSPSEFDFRAAGSRRARASGVGRAVYPALSTLEKAAAMANHSSTRTTRLYDRRGDKITLDEVERVAI
jgi:integrase/recombinase XerC